MFMMFMDVVMRKKVPYTILDSQGEVVTNGLLDDIARTPRIYRETEDALKVLVGSAQILVGIDRNMIIKISRWVMKSSF